MKPLLASLALAALVPWTALAAGPASGVPTAASATQAPAIAPGDADFLKAAAEAGRTEVEAGKIAVEKGVNTQVKGFAQQMVDDHTKANDELDKLALAKGVTLPAEPSLAQKTKVKLLSGRDGGGFDRRYADTFAVGAHRDALRMFQNATKKAADPDIKAYAVKMLPTLEHHFEMAKELKGVVDKEGNVKAATDRKQ